VAAAIETLTTIAPPAVAAQSLSVATRSRNLRWARMCYDHLAGVVGVAVAEALLARSALREDDDGWALGSGTVFAEMGIEVDALRRKRRPLAHPCMDWTERRHHLAGSAGSAVADELTRRGWVRRHDASRIVSITPEGTDGLRDWLGLDLAELRQSVA
jgi:hypothetical protein